MTDVAVLFLTFNRPEQTRAVFNAIRAERPTRLYVACDGARTDRPKEAAQVDAVRKIATSVDWPCQVETLFREENLGCRDSVSGAISWFFENEEQGIILEDDVLPAPGLFRFLLALLDRYVDRPDISMISACTFIEDKVSDDADYFLSHYMHIWGWASWRRAWKNYDLSMSDWGSEAAVAAISQALGHRKKSVRFWIDIFDQAKAGKIDTWDYQWVYSAWRHGMTALTPSRNMIRNLGFGDDATHTTGPAPRQVQKLKLNSPTFPIRHPVSLSVNEKRERRVESDAFGISRFPRLNRLKNRLA
ncbi:MAG: hypothetical protein WA979_02430 [Pacificimonas sp.]